MLKNGSQFFLFFIKLLISISLKIQISLSKTPHHWASEIRSNWVQNELVWNFWVGFGTLLGYSNIRLVLKSCKSKFIFSFLNSHRTHRLACHQFYMIQVPLKCHQNVWLKRHNSSPKSSPLSSKRLHQEGFHQNITK